MAQATWWIAGYAALIAGVLFVWRGWHARRAGRLAERRAFVGIGWLAIAMSFAPWMVAGGADRGVALALIVFMLAGVCLLLHAMFTGKGNGRRGNGRDASSNGASNAGFGGWRLFLRRSWVFLLAGPVSAAAATFAAAALFGLWNVETGSAANRLAAVLLLVPIAWSALAIWATYDVPLRRRSLVVFGFLLAGVAGTFLPGMA